MKKLFLIIAVAGFTFFYACGPSAEELAKKAQEDSILVADSIAKVEAEAKRVQDSIDAVAAIAAEKEKAIQDSIAKAAEDAKAKKGGKKGK